MISGTLNNAQNVAATAEEISVTTKEIASASKNQAAAAQTMNELFVEMSSAINDMARNAE